jgi:hypothetical protein
MHGDHTGQLDAFGHAAFIGGAGSASSAANIGGAGSASSAATIGGAGSSSSVPEPAARRWREERFEHGTRLGPFDDAVDVAGDPGIVLIRGGGHATEGLMLLLALDDGPVLLAGDAVVHGDWLRSDDVQRIPVDPDRAAVVRNEVRAFVDEGAGRTVAYGHDLRGIDCSRRDIVCHRGVRANPEELDTGEVEALVADFVARRPE